MKRTLLAGVAALFLAAFSLVAMAQVQMPPGMTKGGAINQGSFNQNSDAAGFSETSLTPSLAVPATSTAQATFGPGGILTGTVIATRETVITTCSGSTGVTLPAVQHFLVIHLINRSGGSCLVWPSLGATLETALGTVGSVNAPFTMTTNTDVTFRPISATAWDQ